jgi:Rrf2 family transcriptional regulator, cysteine metabolism repressor
MKMSTRGRYGLRAMLDLARHFGERAVMMSDVAEREDLSRKYLHALLTSLRSAGLVRSVRGAGGGFVLTRHPAEIRLNEVVNALEGQLSIVPCVTDQRRCRKSEDCSARRVWQQLSHAVEDMLSSITLQDLLVMERGACVEPRADAPGTQRVKRQKASPSRRAARPRLQKGARK